MLKARFLTELDPGFELIETLRLEQGCYPLLHLHLQRLESSARTLGFCCPSVEIHRELELLAGQCPLGVHHVRLTLKHAGKWKIHSVEFAEDCSPKLAVVADDILDPDDYLLRHKTTVRNRYDKALQALANSPGVFDAIFLNSRGEVCEGARSNVFVERNGVLLTPPAGCGLLPGVLRRSLLDSGRAIEQVQRPTLVLAHNKTLAAQLYAEFREFFPENAVEYFVSYYDYYQPEAYVPQRDLFIEKDSAINEHIEQMRLSCTKSLLERRDVVIVATVSAIYGIGEPESYHRMIMTLRTGDALGQRDAIAQLVRMQYERNDLDFGRGKFRVRGDTIDVFPAEHSELALRIELFDDEVESLQLFDPLTGRIQQKIPRFTVYPSSHYVTPRDKVLAAVETIKEELRERLAFFEREGKLVEAQRLRAQGPARERPPCSGPSSAPKP